MEIKEIISYFFNDDSNIVEVSFRTIDDNEEVFRTDNIDYSIIEDYGFDLMTESFDFFEEDSDDDDDFFDDKQIELDEDELLIFLNEYYTINPSLLPRPKFH